MTYSAVLTKKIKQLLHREISDHFSDDPIFSKKLKIVNHRSDLEDITYGILFRSISASKTQLGFNNYIRNVHSHFSIAKVGNHKSAFINLITEDDLNLFAVYEDNVSSQVTGYNTSFNISFNPVMQTKTGLDIVPCVDPKTIQALVNGKRVGVYSVLPDMKKIFLELPPPANSEVLISYAVRTMASPGYYFLEVGEKVSVNTHNIYLGSFESVDFEKVDLPVPAAQIYIDPLFFKTKDIQIFVDGLLLTEGFTVDKLMGTVTFTSFFQGNSIVIKDNLGATLSFPDVCKYLKYEKLNLVTQALGNEKDLLIPHSNYKSFVLKLNGVELVRGQSSLSTDTSDYYVDGSMIRLFRVLPKGAQLEIEILYFSSESKTQLKVSDLFAGNCVYQLKLKPGDVIFPDFLEVYMNKVLLDPSKYLMDFSTGTLTLTTIPGISSDISVCYRLNRGTSGPFEVTNSMLCNTIIPGAIIYFGNKFEEGDKVVVIVGDQRKNCADEYGGIWELSIELGTVADDPIEAEDLVDKLVMFLWAKLKPKWDAMGLFVQDVQLGSDSNEEKDESTNDVDFQNSVSLVVTGEWIYRVPRKFRFMSFTGIYTNDSSWDISGDYLPMFIDGKPYMSYGGERP